MYIVISFDKDDSTSICLECMTKDLNVANSIYDSIVNDGSVALKELVQVSDDFQGPFCFYWGQVVDGITIIKSNNRD